MIYQFSSVQSLSRVPPFATPWIAAFQASLSITNSQSSPKLMSIESVMPSSHLILCCPLLLLPLIPLSIKVFSNKSTLRMRWPKYCSFSLSISPSSENPGLVSLRWTGRVICISEVIDISPGNLDSSSCFFQLSIFHDVLCIELNKQGDNIQLWRTPFTIWNQSVVPCPVLTVASWPAYRFFKRPVSCSSIPISLRIFHSILWSTQSMALA